MPADGRAGRPPITKLQFFLGIATRMQDRFQIVANAARGLLDIRLDGFWNLEDTERFTVAVYAALERFRGRPAPHVTLVDVSALPPQAQDVLQACHGLRYSEPQPRRMAIVVGEGLSRLQMRRVAGDAFEVFYDRASA